MAGATIVVTTDIDQKLSELIQNVQRPAPLFGQINEYLLRSTRARFKTQTSPDGRAWAALSPRYQKRKHKNANKILTLRGYLQGTLRGQFDDSALEFGSDRVYAALMHFGGSVKRKARKAKVFFKRGADGSVGNRFVKKKDSDFAQDVNVKAHSAGHKPRPYLGLSKKDNEYILRLTESHLRNGSSGKN